MNGTYESINYSENFPYKIFLSNVGSVLEHWHNSLEIILAIEGEIQVAFPDGIHNIKPMEFIIINSKEPHKVTAKSSNVTLTLQISSKLLNPYLNDKIKFHNQGNKETNTAIISHLAKILWIYNKKANNYEAQLNSVLYSLLFILLENLAYESNNNYVTQKYDERIEKIIKFLNEHYNEDISLQTLADKEYLSLSYVSRFFKKYVGIPYKEYISSIRLDRALQDLIYTDLPIIEIATKHGFPSSKALSIEFKKKFTGTINEFRKDNKHLSSYSNNIVKKASNYTELTSHTTFYALFQYIDAPILNTQATQKKPTISIDLRKKKEIKFKHYWENLTSIGSAYLLLRSDVQQQLLEAHHDLGFKQVKFHGLFNDDMMVFSYDNNQPVFYFNYIFKVFDFLINNDMLPFVELGFMPKALASNTSPYFYRECYPSAPNDLGMWCLLVKNFIEAIIDRYSIDTVRKMNFEIWNEPELVNAFWHGTTQEYFEFYQATFNTIKSVDQKIKIGGPSVSNTEDINTWIQPFLNYTKENNCMPEFFSFHVYPHTDTVDELASLLTKGKKSPVFSPNPHYLSTIIQVFCNMLEPYGYNYSNIYITEWNSSASHRELTHDTCYKSCYIVKQLTENINKLNIVNHWVLSDIIEEFNLPTSEFHGGLGLITQNNIKKASYYAYALLHKLGDTFITRGNNYFICQKNNVYQVLLFNYCHFDDLYQYNERSHISDSDRYNVFKDDYAIDLSIDLIFGYVGTLMINEYIIDRDHGSAYDCYNKMGCPNNLTDDDINYLKGIRYLENKKSIAIDNTYLLNTTLQPHTVKLYEFILKNK